MTCKILFEIKQNMRDRERDQKGWFFAAPPWTITSALLFIGSEDKWGERGPSRVPEIGGTGITRLWYECGRGKRKDRWFEDRMDNGISSGMEVQRHGNNIWLGHLPDRIWWLISMKLKTLSRAQMQAIITMHVLGFGIGLDMILGFLHRICSQSQVQFVQVSQVVVQHINILLTQQSFMAQFQQIHNGMSHSISLMCQIWSHIFTLKRLSLPLFQKLIIRNTSMIFGPLL